MPETQGPPMKIHTAPNAVPHVVHKPAPGPLHWRERVAKDIEADVSRGILERVPPGIPETWCTRMVITWKKNGEPRRKVDLAALSKAGIRKTHHTRSPFNVVRSIPSETQKTTLACKYGYHGVPLAEEDRQKTTFITEQGRFRYARATQGYGSSNDGYTQRTDKILRNCAGGMHDYEMIVDDIIQWSGTIEQAFFRICKILSHCSGSGMVLKSAKSLVAK